MCNSFEQGFSSWIMELIQGWKHFKCNKYCLHSWWNFVALLPKLCFIVHEQSCQIHKLQMQCLKGDGEKLTWKINLKINYAVFILSTCTKHTKTVASFPPWLCCPFTYWSQSHQWTWTHQYGFLRCLKVSIKKEARFVCNWFHRCKNYLTQGTLGHP